MADPPTPLQAELGHALDHAAHYLPGQGPIGVFVHHNTLHAFEHLPFEDAIEMASTIFGAEPFAAESEFRAAFARGRILERDLDAVLSDTLGAAATETLIAGVSRLELRKHALLHLRDEPSPNALAWQLEEGQLFAELRARLDAATRAKLAGRTRGWAIAMLERGNGHELGRCLSGSDDPEAGKQAVSELLGSMPLRSLGTRTALSEELALRCLWGACTLRFSRMRAERRRPEPRLRDALLRKTGEDVDVFVHPTLIRICSAFLDQGVAYWPMPERERGLYIAARELLAQPGPPPNPWVRLTVEEMQRQLSAGSDAPQIALEIIEELGLGPEELGPFVEATLLALPGWAGMIRQLEQRPDRAPVHAPPTSLLDFFALRLALERETYRFIAARHGLPERPLSALWAALRETAAAPAPKPDVSLVHDAFIVLAHAGVAAPELLAQGPEDSARFAADLDAFDSVARRKIWHLAYELRHRHQILDALAVHTPLPAPAAKFQTVFCIDERAESIRRHLEEVLPEAETWGTAGFFGVAMYYRGIDDAHALPLCPIAITPQHEVHEHALPGASKRLERRRVQRRLAGQFAQGAYVGSRTFVRGTIWSAALGMLSAIPLVLRVIFPWESSRVDRGMRQLSLPKLETSLAVERFDDQKSEQGRLLGFTLEEMTAIVAGVLEDMGLTRRFAPLVLIVGHGSSSLNNPHESAHDCGACGGGRGGPNARAFAQMANHAGVRERLKLRGIQIPSGTWFLGALHDTCNDSITYFDLGLVPSTHAEPLAQLRSALDKARALDAHERCRRFESASITLSPREALRHVEGRAEDLAQPRPEYGHATNAVAIIGRRARTRGLFLDRRAFLVSYDSTIDPDGRLLARLLASVVPVGAGINLEYYFSYVDPVRFGCATKLPHNVTGLVGVMDGYSSDLRTGLPWQMVEIHEPVRLLTVIEAKPEIVTRAAATTPSVLQLVKNRWLRLATLDPDSNELHVYRDGELAPYTPEHCELTVVDRSAAWYTGQREHLPPARVRRS